MYSDNKIYNEGYEAYAERQESIGDNPYAEGTKEHQDWADGYSMACDDHMEHLSDNDPLRPEDYDRY